MVQHLSQFMVTADEQQALQSTQPTLIYNPQTTASGASSRTQHRQQGHSRIRGAHHREVQPAGGPLLSQRTSLPAWRFQQEIVQTVLLNQVTVICGETGCGKSTQVPQFIIDSMGVGEKVNMIVTQPRRISAVVSSVLVAISCTIFV